MSLAVATVRYHRSDDGTYWGECGSWTGAADTLDELRVLAREGLGFTFGGEWRMRCFFEMTAPADDGTNVILVPSWQASEEFGRVPEKTHKGD